MRILIMTVYAVLLMVAPFLSYAQSDPLKESIDLRIDRIEKEMLRNKEQLEKFSRNITVLSDSVNNTNVNLNELHGQIDQQIINIEKIKSSVDLQVDGIVNELNRSQALNHDSMSHAKNQVYGVCLLMVLLSVGCMACSFVMYRRYSRMLQVVQSKYKEILEGYLDLNIRFMDICIDHDCTVNKEDHSLATKIADEITRIEINLSRMDSSVRGYKQIAKSIERIRNNYRSNGYELVELLNKPYDEGMKMNADFVIDESLPPGMRIITSVSKPQINYNGVMIQKATVTVSQNI